MSTDNSAISVFAVDNQQKLTEFIQLPWRLYQNDPNWIPPLIIEQKQRLGAKNPFFEHACWQAWVACRDGKTVGRISAQIDQLYLDTHQKQAGYFGMLEAEDDAEIFSALFSTAENWLINQGITTVLGPFNLSINEESGLLVDGFETPPSIMMGHALPYYEQHLQLHGFSKAKDLLAWKLSSQFTATPVMKRLVDQSSDRIQIRSLRRKDLANELELLRDIFNDAWSENWGFVPLTKAEFDELGKVMTLLLDDDFVQIAELDGEPAAMVVALPNINEAIRDLNGRLFPFGWLKLLWRLKVKYPGTARIPLMGIRKKYHRSRIGTTLSFMVVSAVRDALVKRGIGDIELSWTLEDNTGVNSLIESTGGRVYKTYRIYQKNLAESPEPVV